MNDKKKTLVIAAIVAALAAVPTLTSINLVQQADAASCQTFFPSGKENCSSGSSGQHATAFNFNRHLRIKP